MHLLSEVGVRCSNDDAGLYIRKDGKCFIFLWVDDLFVICTSAEVKATIEPILTKFKGRDLGQLEWALGCRITRDLSKKTITMSQCAKVSNLLEKFGMQDCRRAPTPYVPRQQMRALKYHKDLVLVSACQQSRFMSVVGSIQYVAQVTRRDLAYFAGALAQHFSESTEEHWQAAMHCLRYLQSTKNFGLTFDGSLDDAPLVEAYSDARLCQFRGQGECLWSGYLEILFAG